MRALLKWFMALSLGTCLLVLVIPGCGRSSLEQEFIDGGPIGSSGSSGNATCGPSTCSNGCCDANGACQTGRAVTECGSIGGRCANCQTQGFSTCTSARSCGKPVATCNASTCPNGCCTVDSDGNPQCLSGTEGSACGKAGAACQNCEDDGRACDINQRTCSTATCDATNCNGCCLGDLCLPGDSTVACGANGGQCGTCGPKEVCRVTGAGASCEGAPTACNSANCGGCCTSTGQCLSGLDNKACGAVGQRCDTCNTDEQCLPDGVVGARTCQPVFGGCDASNCNGCCSGDICFPTSDAFCGIKGQQCQTCDSTQTCDASGTCQNTTTSCGPLSCPGCCIGDICAVGTQNTACGANGTDCANCANQFPAETCQSGSCQAPACGPTTCPFGCCTASGVCVTGTQDQQCGNGFGGGGKACVDCTTSGQSCVGGQCQSKCNAGNCAGCCQGNTCVNGVSNSACGAGGAQCSNCSGAGDFCDGLVVPRTCSSKQTTCPADYPGCNAGTTLTPVKEAQGVCSDSDLDTIAFSCTTGGDQDLLCQITIASEPAACATCIDTFNHPFVQDAGLWACAASSVNGPCQHSLACASECDSTSCEQCGGNTEQQCFGLVNSTNGQCRTEFNATSCANSALAAGQLCSQFSYPSYSDWLRSVGGHFCGSGN